MEKKHRESRVLKHSKKNLVHSSYQHIIFSAKQNLQPIALE